MKTDWNTVKHLTKRECAPRGPNDSHYWDMHTKLIAKVDDIREQLGRPVIVSKNGGYATEGHSRNSLHYAKPDIDDGANIGRALDFHIQGFTWYEAACHVWAALDGDTGHWGLGMHPHSNTGFIHLDYRADIYDKSAACWWRDNKGKYTAYALREFPACLISAGLDAGRL